MINLHLLELYGSFYIYSYLYYLQQQQKHTYTHTLLYVSYIFKLLCKNVQINILLNMKMPNEKISY